MPKKTPDKYKALPHLACTDQDHLTLFHACLDRRFGGKSELSVPIRGRKHDEATIERLTADDLAMRMSEGLTALMALLPARYTVVRGDMRENGGFAFIVGDYIENDEREEDDREGRPMYGGGYQVRARVFQSCSSSVLAVSVETDWQIHNRPEVLGAFLLRLPHAHDSCSLFDLTPYGAAVMEYHVTPSIDGPRAAERLIEALMSL